MRSDLIKKGVERAPHRSLLRATGVRECSGAFEQNVAEGLSIRHDHGSRYVSDDFQQEIAFLSMTSSPSFVRAPEVGGVAERFIRTLKENLLWAHHFEAVEELR